MRNTFGNNIKMTLFGASHQEHVGVILEGIPAGIPIDMKYMNKELAKRKAIDSLSTARHETDEPHIITGMKDGLTDGNVLTIQFDNSNSRSQDYEILKHIARPGHADYTAYVKYQGQNDMRGGGQFSGRMTVGIVAAGSIFKKLLEDNGVLIGSHILSLHGISDRELSVDNLNEDIMQLNESQFAVLDQSQASLMKQEILNARQKNDSVGGVLETAVSGLEAGIGEPLFDSLESMLAHALFSIGGVKGVEFGNGFAAATLLGSENNDPMRIDNGRVITLTNNAGGINGGITNGMPVIFKTAFKPTSSISIPQETIDFVKMENAVLELKGRHDTCIIHRARCVVDNITAFVLADLLIESHGHDWLRSSI